MQPAQAFKLLGTERTADRREVRRAYAALLKQIDPDKDVAGFLKLRAALDCAENEIRWRDARAAAALEEDEEEHEFGGEFPVLEPAPEDAPQPSQPPLAATSNTAPLPDLPPLPETARAEFVEVPPLEPHGEVVLPSGAASEGLVTVRLQPPGGPDPFAEVRRRFVAAVTGQGGDPAEGPALFEALLGDPRLAAIDTRERFENWLAELLFETGPSADPVVTRAAEVFGWAGELEAINPRWLQARIAQRADDIAVIGRLEQPGHRWHEAYVTLMQPAPKRIPVTRRIALRDQVEALLASLRRHNPWVEDRFDPDHVKLWEHAMGVGGSAGTALFRDGISPFGWAMIIYLVLQIVAWWARV